MKVVRMVPFHYPTSYYYRVQLQVKKTLLTRVLNLKFRIRKIAPLKVTINLKRQAANNNG